MNKKSNMVSGEIDNTEAYQNSYFAYLNEIGKYKLLSADEEVLLFQKIEAGDNVAKELFIKSNLRLVVSVAKKYYIPGHNDLLDLIEEGNLGLIKAVEQFDLSRGCKFSTYARYKINKAIQKSPLRSGLPVELPAGKLALIAKIKSAIFSFEEENERKPSTMELSSILNIPVDRIAVLMPYIVSSVSLNNKLDNHKDDQDAEFIDMFEEYYKDDISDAENALIAKEMKEELQSILSEILNQKEIYIINSRWGLSNVPAKDVSKLAVELNMSQQGVRQCEERARMKLKKHLLSLNKSISDFI